MFGLGGKKKKLKDVYFEITVSKVTNISAGLLPNHSPVVVRWKYNAAGTSIKGSTLPTEGHPSNSGSSLNQSVGAPNSYFTNKNKGATKRAIVDTGVAKWNSEKLCFANDVFFVDPKTGKLEKKKIKLILIHVRT